MNEYNVAADKGKTVLLCRAKPRERDPQLSERIEAYWRRRKFISKAEAVRQLLLIALEAEEKK